MEENARRKARAGQPEFELLDTGIFDDDRYFDVFVEYAKAGPEDILMRVTVHNRGPEEATIHLLPQLWFRNTWSWNQIPSEPEIARGKRRRAEREAREFGDYSFYCDGKPEFCSATTKPMSAGFTARPMRRFFQGRASTNMSFTAIMRR